MRGRRSKPKPKPRPKLKAESSPGWKHLGKTNNNPTSSSPQPPPPLHLFSMPDLLSTILLYLTPLEMRRARGISKGFKAVLEDERFDEFVFRLGRRELITAYLPLDITLHPFISQSFSLLETQTILETHASVLLESPIWPDVSKLFIEDNTIPRTFPSKGHSVGGGSEEGDNGLRIVDLLRHGRKRLYSLKVGVRWTSKWNLVIEKDLRVGPRGSYAAMNLSPG